MIPEPRDPFAALRIRDFTLFAAARFLLTFSIQIQTVTVGWQVYHITRDPLSLGFIGLAEAIPSIGVSLFGGVLADKVQRKLLIKIFTGVLVICSGLLFSITKLWEESQQAPLLYSIYSIVFFSGLARGCIGPAIFAFWPQLIQDKKYFSNAVVWNSTVWQISSTVGPAVGGLMLAPLGIANTYLADGCIMAASWLLFQLIPARPLPEVEQHHNFMQHLTEGIRFVYKNSLILSALTLDLFAVLFGGAVALLPVYAKDILHVGAFEFGLLKSAMGVGSVVVVLTMAFIPIKRYAGLKMLYAVGLFGVSMIGFGLSTHFIVAMLFLFFAGVFDGISVVIRGTLVQLYTPDHMKGRVSAVNNIFIGSSNELGAFESGLAARLLGVVNSVVFGGIMAIGVTIVTGILATKLRKLHFK